MKFRIAHRARVLLDRAGVVLTLHLLRKKDRLFEYHWASVIASAILGAALFAYGFSLLEKNIFLSILLMSAALLPVFVIRRHAKWVFGCDPTDIEALNRVVKDYGFARRDFYALGEAFLVNRFLAPARRAEQDALALSVGTQAAKSKASRPRL